MHDKQKECMKGPDISAQFGFKYQVIKVKEKQAGSIVDEQAGVYPVEAFHYVNLFLLYGIFQQKNKSGKGQYDNQHALLWYRIGGESKDTLKEQRVDNREYG